MTGLNYIELAHLERAGINIDDWSTELPLEVVRQLHSDILTPNLQFDVTYLKQIEQNPLTKKLLESLSLLYVNTRQRKWDPSDPVDEEYMQLTDPTNSNGLLWDEQARNFLDMVYLSREQEVMHARHHSYIRSWLTRHLGEEDGSGKSLDHENLLLVGANTLLFSILLAKPNLPKRFHRKWRKLNAQAEKIAEDIIRYEQETRVN